MSDTPKVTVAIPTYNRASLLKQCLGTILRQTFQEFEVIVSDNCSPDSTPDTVRAFTDPRIRYSRNESNLGVFPNMNRCLELARGEYIAIVHDDDLFAPRFLEEEVRVLDGHPSVGMVHCATYETDPHGAPQRLVQVYPEDRVMAGKDAFIRYLEGHNIHCSTVMARTALFREVGGFEPGYRCADYHLWLKMALRADVAFLASPLAAVRIHEGRLSSALEPQHWFDEFSEIFELGLAWGEAACPERLGSKAALRRRVAQTQGRRFLIAALAAAAEGDHATVAGCADVLGRLETWGLPHAYAMLARASANPLTRVPLFMARTMRRLRAKRSVPTQTGW